MRNKAVEQLLSRAPSIKVLVIGDIMLDKYLFGKVERMSPEAPVPVLRHEKTERKVGGAGNVALNFRALGCQTLIAGLLGEDEEGKLLAKKFEDESISNHCVLSTSRPTTVKTRVMNGEEHLLRVDFECTAGIDEETAHKFLSELDTVFSTQDVDLVVIQDYNKGLLTEEVISVILDRCKSNGCFTSVDPKFDNYWVYKNVNLFKPNLKEASIALGLKDKEAESWTDIADDTRRRLAADYIVLTLSENGIIVCQKDGFYHEKPDPIEVVDVCGAGDGVLTVVSLLSYMGFEKEQLVRVGNLAGRQICLKPGVSILDPDEF